VDLPVCPHLPAERGVLEAVEALVVAGEAVVVATQAMALLRVVTVAREFALSPHGKGVVCLY
jgi:hypothetical protein